MERAITAMLTRMCDEYASGPLPLDPDWRHVQYDDAGRVHCLYGGGSQSRSPRAFVEAIKQVWLAEGYLKAFQEAWLNDPAMDDLSYASSFDTWRSSNGLLERVARISLLRLLSSDPNPIRQEDVVAFASDLRSHSQRFVAVAPISGITVGDDPLVLSQSASVRLLSPVEHDFLVNSAAFGMDQRTISVWWRHPVVIETQLPVDYHRNLQNRMDEAAEIVRNVRTALSICTDRDVYTPGLFGSLDTAFPVLINHSEPSAVPMRSGYPWPLPLDEAARRSIKLMWERQDDAVGGARVALHRLAFLIDRQEMVDSLIDAWVALEAMFTGRELHGELRFRLAFRIANFLGTSALQRQELFDVLYDSYGMRSRLVHGSKNQPAESDLTDRLARTVTIARQSAYRFLTSDRKINPDELDSEPFV